jgi:predicted nucleic acid-binding protein
VSGEVLLKYVPVPALDTGERHLLSLAQTLPGTEILVLIDDELARAEAPSREPWESSSRPSGRSCSR